MTTLVRTHQVQHIPPGSAQGRTLDAILNDAVSVTDYGAVGDGVADDSAAVQACITAAQAEGKAVAFPDGVFNVANLPAQQGHLVLHGSGDTTLRGGFTYSQASFPQGSAPAPAISPSSPRFEAVGIRFEASGTGWALSLLAQEQTATLETFALDGCQFFGGRGLLVRHMQGFTISRCIFNTTVIGAQLESCLRGSWVQCFWHDQANAAVRLVAAASATYNGGGSGSRFALCDFTDCVHGVLAEAHTDIELLGCRINCGLPISLTGGSARLVSCSLTFTASPISKYSAAVGYLAPPVTGAAVYARSGGSPQGSTVVSVYAHASRFNGGYSGSSQPTVSINGYVNSTYPQAAWDATFYDCSFNQEYNHSAAAILDIQSCKSVTVMGNRFASTNANLSLAAAWRAQSCAVVKGHTNDFQRCTQSGSVVGSPNEMPLAGVYVQATDPGAVGAGAIWVTP